MATQPITKPLISVEEYLSTTYRPDCEYKDGIIEERNLGEFDHSFLQAVIATLFTNKIAEWGVFALTEQRVQLGPRRFLIPDVTVLRVGSKRERILTHPPLIAIELMSPKDTLRNAEKKSYEYLDFGIEHIWIVDPIRRVAYRATRSGLETVPSGQLTISETPILVSVPELFERLDQF